MVSGVYELVAQRAAALALVEPVGQQDKPVPVVVQATYVAWEVARYD
ncbi:MAG: hypothetical protein U0O07_03125 [Bifidobacterium catenulatum]